MNTATLPSRLRRFAAVLVTGALIVLGSIVATSPAAAATVNVTGGSLSWGLADSSYRATFATRTAGSPASHSAATDTFEFPATAGSAWDSSSRSGTIAFTGNARLGYFAGAPLPGVTSGNYVYISNPVVAITGTTGTISGMTAGDSHGLNPELPKASLANRTVATLDFSAVTPTISVDQTQITWQNVPAFVTADGAAVIADYDSATDAMATKRVVGTALDPVTITITLDPPATPEFTAATYNAGTATWGISTYLNTAGGGKPTPLSGGYVAPATYTPATSLSTWGNATGTLSEDGIASLAFSGTSVNFAPTGGGWLRLADIQATLDASGNGSVSAVVSYGVAPGTYPNIAYSASQTPVRGPQRVTIVALAGNAVPPTQTSTSVSWSGLAGSWSTDFLTYLAGDPTASPAIASWIYASTITNDPALSAGARLASPFSFTLGNTPLVTTTTTLTATPATQVTAGGNVALTATVAPALAGTVTFSNGSTVLATVPVTNGVATHTIAAAAAGDYALTATFTPTDAAHNAASTGALAYTVNAPVAASPGSLTWGVKQSLQSYVLGGGSISTSSGAGYNGVRFSFPQTSSASYNHETGTGSSSYGGSATFAYPAHGFSIGLANPRVQLTSASAGTLYVDVTYNGATTGGIAFATLGLGSASKTSTGTTTTYSNVSATLTAAGATAFQGFYTAGTALDPMSFVIGAPSTGFASTTKAAVVNEPDATPPTTQGITAGSSAAVEGEEFTATASGFAPNESDILVVIYSQPVVLDTVTADKSGLVSWTGILPTGLTGEHTLTFQGSVDRGIVLDIAPATATAAAEGCVVESGDLTWGFKESFRSYISGSIANGEWTVADGATYETPSFGFSGATGAYDAASASGLVSFPGSITFTGHGGVLNTTVANPQIRFDDESTATVILDVSGTTQEGAAIDQHDVEFATVDLSAATVTNVDGVVTITDAPAELTADGSAAFGTYEPGEVLDPITLSFTTVDCAAAPTEQPAAIDDEPTSSATDLTWLWIVLAVLLALVIIAVVVVIARRRTA